MEKEKKFIHCSKCRKELHEGDVYFFSEDSAANYCVDCAKESKYFKHFDKEVLTSDLADEILENGEEFDDEE